VSVDPLFAQWLQAPTLWHTASDAAIAARWGATAIVSERQTGIASQAHATTEAERQLAFLARGPFAVDLHQVSGDGWAARLATVVTLTVDQLGYSGGIDVFIIEAEPDLKTGFTTLAVLRSLKDGA
jgi:hypothetical protein